MYNLILQLETFYPIDTFSQTYNHFLENCKNKIHEIGLTCDKN